MAGTNPTYVLARVAREGVSYGALSGRKRTPKRWSGRSIQELARQLKGSAGNLVPVYVGHDSSGVHGRTQVGHLVASETLKRNGKLEALGVIRMTDGRAADSVQRGNLDTVSIEAELELSRTGTEQIWEVNSVRKLTGVALASSNKGEAGFKDAKIIGTVAEMNDNGNEPGGERGDMIAQALLAAEDSLGGLNLAEPERRFVMNSVVRNLGNLQPTDDVTKKIKDEMSARVGELDELKKLYRRQSNYTSAPAEKPHHKIPTNFKDYLDPDLNDLIPN